jgi:hypothetical protein
LACETHPDQWLPGEFSHALACATHNNLLISLTGDKDLD